MREIRGRDWLHFLLLYLPLCYTHPHPLHWVFTVSVPRSIIGEFKFRLRNNCLLDCFIILSYYYLTIRKIMFCFKMLQNFLSKLIHFKCFQNSINFIYFLITRNAVINRFTGREGSLDTFRDVGGIP